MALVTVSLLVLFPSPPLIADPYRIAVFDYDIRSPGEKTVARHIEQQLAGAGLGEHMIQQFCGEENEGRAAIILAGLESQQYDLIITITSDAMAPAFHQIRRTPWLFTNVNNPKIFGIRDPKKPGRNMSGVTYYVPVGRQLELFQAIMGGRMKKIGLIFDLLSKSRRAELGEFRLMASVMGLEYRIELLKSPQELPSSAQRLIHQKVDGIILTSSDALYNNVHLILDRCTRAKTPIFSVHQTGVAAGAIAAYASDYFRMVDECLIPMAVSVLKEKKNPGDMPVRQVKNPSIYLNATQAKKLGIAIPADILQKAVIVY
ncbi:MAG: ABC transporter substrate-binding protein [Thermodesulfobacteriota bacterium]